MFSPVRAEPPHKVCARAVWCGVAGCGEAPKTKERDLTKKLWGNIVLITGSPLCARSSTTSSMISATGCVLACCRCHMRAFPLHCAPFAFSPSCSDILGLSRSLGLCLCLGLYFSHTPVSSLSVLHVLACTPKQRAFSRAHTSRAPKQRTCSLSHTCCLCASRARVLLCAHQANFLCMFYLYGGGNVLIWLGMSSESLAVVQARIFRIIFICSTGPAAPQKSLAPLVEPLCLLTRQAR